MMKKITLLVVFTVLVIGSPLLGVVVSGRPVQAFISFPPFTRPIGHAPFSWPVFGVYLLPVLGIVGGLVVLARKKGPGDLIDPPAAAGRWPWWGWPACCALLVSWVAAWTRLPWMAGLQRHTFLPLWLSYIAVANALCCRQSGSCPCERKPVFFLALFPISSVFWWYFEYLNQFARNWYYTGVDYGAIPYSIYATLSFSTVLPAVYTTRVLLFDMRWFRRGFHGLPPLRLPGATPVAGAMLVAGCLGLVGVVLWPDGLFAMLWTAPVVIFASLQYMTGRRSIFSALADGDWRPVLSAAAAALVCGIFWEMWNYHSLAKWMYSIPYVSRFRIFEMPVLGYMGYLPFGLECIAVAELFEMRERGAALPPCARNERDRNAFLFTKRQGD